MKRLVLLAVLVFGVMAPGASAVVLVNPDGSPVGGHWQKWADRAQVPTPPGPVELRKGGCFEAQANACAWREGVYTGDGSMVRDTFLHELGHVFDYNVMTNPARRRFLFITANRYPWAERNIPWAERPVEHFANAYANCALGSRTAAQGRIYSEGKHRRICALLRRVAARAEAALRPAD